MIWCLKHGAGNSTTAGGLDKQPLSPEAVVVCCDRTLIDIVPVACNSNCSELVCQRRGPLIVKQRQTS